MSDDFFGSSDVQDMAESHAEKLLSISEREANRIIKVYKRVRADLRDRLDTVQPGTFTSQRMQSTLMQVDAGLRALQRDVSEEMGTATENVAGGSVEDLVSEIKKYEKVFVGASIPINLNAGIIASDVRSLLLTRIESSFNNYNGFLRSRIAYGLSESVIAQDSFSEVVRKINLTLMGEEYKAERIVRTELHNVYSMGKIEGMRDLVAGDIPDLKKALYHPMDKRTGDDSKKAKRLNLVVDVDDYFEYEWNGETRRFFQPPDRPQDRSILIPYRDSWSK